MPVGRITPHETSLTGTLIAPRRTAGSLSLRLVVFNYDVPSDRIKQVHPRPTEPTPFYESKIYDLLCLIRFQELAARHSTKEPGRP